MKKGIIISTISLVLLIALGVYFVKIALPREIGFDVPINSKYVVTYATGRYSNNELSEINYFDAEGAYISSNYIKSGIDPNAFTFDNRTGFSFFTLDGVYINKNNQEKYFLKNNEVLDIYNFATDDGLDNVYQSGKIDKLNMNYKVATHGLSYSHEELGFFDLFILYDDKDVTTIRIPSVTEVAVDQEKVMFYAHDDRKTEELYPIDASPEHFCYEVFRYDEETGLFDSTYEKLDLSNLLKTMDLGDINYYDVAIGPGLIDQGVLYQFFSFSDVSETEEIFGKYETYLCEIELGSFGQDMRLKGSYKLYNHKDLGGVLPEAKDGQLFFYNIDGEVPEVIIFDTQKKDFSIREISFQDKINNDDITTVYRFIRDSMYVMITNTETFEYKIVLVEEDGNVVDVASGKLPKSHIPLAYWLQDFYIIEDS